MEHPNTTPSSQPGWNPGTLATVSLVISIISLLCLCSPPIQLMFGGLAVMFALLSKQDNNYQNMAIAGLLIGIVSCVISLLMFWLFLGHYELLSYDQEYISNTNELFRRFKQMLLPEGS